MRSVSVIFLLSIFFVAIPAKADTPRICQGKNFGTCFQVLLQERCAAYANWNLLSKREYFCEESVIEMMDLLDPFQPKDDPDHVVAFPKQIGELVTNPAAFAYLRDLPAEIDRSIQAGQLFSLWDFTLRRAGNEDRALKWIAVLFQDNHPDENIVLEEARVGFGSKKARKLTSRERKIWEDAITAVSFDRLADRSESSDSVFLLVYPNVDSAYFSTGMYHFYMAAHLARETQKARKSETVPGIDMNGFAPFLLNAMYEMHSDIDPDRSPLKDARPFDANEKWHSLRDLYSGYVGALYGLGGATLVAKADSYDAFSKRFAADPSGTIRGLYRNFRPAR